MCLRHMVIISVFSHGFLIESSTHHLPVHLQLPFLSAGAVLYNMPDSFTSLQLNNILQRKSHK